MPTRTARTVFAQVAPEAKAGCPVSKALTGVGITLDAQLEH